MMLYNISRSNTNFRVALCPERIICPTWAIEYVAAKKEPFNQRRRWLINSGSAFGTSVSPIAPFTYLNTLEIWFT